MTQQGQVDPKRSGVLEAIYVYPIKSCAPQRVGMRRARLLPFSPPSAMQGEASVCSPDVTAGEDVVEEGECVQGNSKKTGAPWPLGPSGLAYDREWVVVDRRNRALRLKQVRARVMHRNLVMIIAEDQCCSPSCAGDRREGGACSIQG